MLKPIIIFLSSLIIAGLLAVGAQAATTKCGVRNEIIQLLEAKYQEGRVAVALSQKSTEAFEIFVSPKGTWTVMRTGTNGKTCIMAAGHSWENVDEKAKVGKQS